MPRKEIQRHHLEALFSNPFCVVYSSKLKVNSFIRAIWPHTPSQQQMYYGRTSLVPALPFFLIGQTWKCLPTWFFFSYSTQPLLWIPFSALLKKSSRRIFTIEPAVSQVYTTSDKHLLAYFQKPAILVYWTSACRIISSLCENFGHAWLTALPSL